jgi:hypothetical protein
VILHAGEQTKLFCSFVCSPSRRVYAACLTRRRREFADLLESLVGKRVKTTEEFSEEVAVRSCAWRCWPRACGCAAHAASIIETPGTYCLTKLTLDQWQEEHQRHLQRGGRMTIEAYVESKMDPEDLQDKQAALIRELQDHMQGYDNGTPVSVSASADESQFHERSYAPPVPPAGGWIAAPADLQASHCARPCA